MDRKIIDETNEQIESLIEARNAELQQISEELTKAHTDLNKALDEQKKASDEMNTTAYTKACRKVEDIETVIGMYEMRRDTITAKEMIPEGESDQKIAALLQYEQDIAAEYANIVREHIKAINAAYDEYNKNVTDAEKTISTWEYKIHPNYRSFGKTRYANGTDRNEFPIPVHRTAYDGGALNVALRTMLGYDAIKILVEE